MTSLPPHSSGRVLSLEGELFLVAYVVVCLNPRSCFPKPKPSIYEELQGIRKGQKKQLQLFQKMKKDQEKYEKLTEEITAKLDRVLSKFVSESH